MDEHTGDALFSTDIRLDGYDSSLPVFLLSGSGLKRLQSTSCDVDPGTILTESSGSDET